MLTTMKTRIALTAAIFGVLALSGCAGGATEAEATPSPTPEPDNTAACEAFWTATVDLATALTGDENAITATEGMEADFDRAYLAAHGEVADRIQRTMDNFPAEGLHMIYLDEDQFISDMESVVRACRADGVPLDQATTVEP